MSPSAGDFSISTRWASFSAIRTMSRGLGGAPGAFHQAGQNVWLARAVNELSGVYAKTADVKFPHPVLGIADEELAHRVAA
jgi:hypothetical protein